MRRARDVYRLGVAYAALGALGVVLSLVAALRSLDFTGAPSEELLAACRRLVAPHVGPTGTAALGLGALAFAAMGLGVRSAARQMRATRGFLRRLEVLGPVAPKDSANALLFRHELPHAFCAGLLRPRVYVSSAARRVLTDRELAAVLAHEQHHAARRDPLRLFAATVFADALFFVPALRRLRDRYAEIAEVAADEAALRAVADRAPLASALLRLGEATAPGAVRIAPERVDNLVGERVRWRVPVGLMVAGAVVSAAVAGAGVLVAGMPARRIDLPLVAAQSCMLLMALAAVFLVLGWAGWLGRLARRR